MSRGAPLKGRKHAGPTGRASKCACGWVQGCVRGSGEAALQLSMKNGMEPALGSTGSGFCRGRSLDKGLGGEEMTGGQRVCGKVEGGAEVALWSRQEGGPGRLCPSARYGEPTLS